MLKKAGQDLRSNGVYAGLPRSDPDGFLDVGEEDLAVPDPPGLGGTADRLDGFLDHLISEHNLDFHLGEKIDHVFRPAIKFGVALLPAEAFCFGDSDALQSHFLQRLLHFIELEGLDDRLDFFHCVSVSSPTPTASRTGNWLAGSMPSADERENPRSVRELRGPTGCPPGPPGKATG